MIVIAILEISIAAGSTPGGGGKAIPAQTNMNPINVPINPNPQANSPKSNTNFLSLKNVYELAATAVKKYAGITTINKLIGSHSEPIPPVFSEPIIHAPTKATSAIPIFNIFILFPFLIS